MLRVVLIAIIFIVSMDINESSAGITLDNTIVIGNPNASNIITVFTEPDCPYCRKAHQEFKQLVNDNPDIAVFVKLYPLPMHPKAYDKSRTIIETMSQEYLERAFSGSDVPEPSKDSSKNIINSIISEANSNDISGTPTMIMPNGKKIVGLTKAAKLSELVRENSGTYFTKATPKSVVSTAHINKPLTDRNDSNSPIVKSDIDELPKINTKTNKNSYAVVIGIESYRQKLPKADFAVNDAKTMASYLTKVLGYPEENIITLTNDYATKSDFEKYLDRWLVNNIDKDSNLFVYYSGHGSPSAKTGDAYLVPYDGDPAFIEETGYSLKRLYANLEKLPAKNIIVALDSCFSGAGGKSVSAKGSRALVRVEKTTARNIAVLTASADNQISSSFEAQGHGVFTYYLLKGIKGALEDNKLAKIEIGDLYNYIKPQVEKTSRKLYNNEQPPQLIINDERLRSIGLR